MLSGLHQNLPSASLAAATVALGGPAQSSVINFRLFLPFVPFPLLLLALLLVLPGIREQRALSLLAIFLHLLVGTLLVASLVLPFWKCSQAEVLVHLHAHSKQRHLLRLGVGIGLRALNISLDYVRPFEGAQANPIALVGLHLNEQFDLAGVSSMATELQRAYHEGLPFPILRVLEYFSLCQDAFSWGHQFRNAGHFAHALLWASFACWLAQCVLLPLVPHHFAKVGLLCGIFILIADLLYVALSPSDLHIAFPSPSGRTNFLQFRFGSCFWMSVSAGLLSLLFASILILLQFLRLYSLSTFLNCSLDETVGPPKCRFGGGRCADGMMPGGRRGVADDSTAICSSSDDNSTRSRLDSTPSCKFSVASSISSLSVSSSVCSSISASAALRMVRTHQRGGEMAESATTKSVEMIRNRILARQHQQEGKGRAAMVATMGETILEEEPMEAGGLVRRKEGVVGMPPTAQQTHGGEE